MQLSLSYWKAKVAEEEAEYYKIKKENYKDFFFHNMKAQARKITQ